MTAFLWTMIALLAIGMFGGALTLLTQNKERCLWAIPFDILIQAALIAWAVSLLP